MKSKYAILIVVYLFVLVAETRADVHLSLLPDNGTTFLPLDDRGYRDIENDVAKGLASLDLMTNRPVFLEYSRQNYPEQNLVGLKLKDDHRDSRERKSNWLDRNYHVYSYHSDDGSSFAIDPRFTFRVDNGDGKTIIRRGSGIQFRGSIRNRLGYSFRFVDNTERGNGPYTTRKQLLEDHYGYVGPLLGGNETYYDATEAYLNWGNDWVNLTFGKDNVSWGPGRMTNLLLSDNAPSFNHFRAKAKISDNARFTYLVGRLQPTDGFVGDTLYKTSDGWVRTETSAKWITAHRLEYAPREWLLLSVSEALIWGERGLEMPYLNPLYFLYSAQHDGNDQDNVLLSGDFIAGIHKKALFYGALLIDDMKISKLGSGEPGNKLAIMAGLFCPDAGMSGFDAGLEYVRLEPYVYSHFFPINRYSNWNSAIGADLPPNSDRLSIDFRFRPAFDITLKARASLNRHGSIGGSVTESLPKGGSEKVYFLDGIREEWKTASFSAEWEFIPGAVVEAGILGNERDSLIPDRWYFSIGYKI